jgi:hypothetical protein
MALNLFVSDETAKAAVDAAAAKCNGGTIKVYAGSQPTDANTAVGAQALLATFSFASTAFGASAASGSAPNRSAVATAASISDVAASGTGTAAWFRALKNDGSSVVMDGSVGVSGCDLNLTDVSLTSGEDVSISSFTISQPES